MTDTKISNQPLPNSNPVAEIITIGGELLKGSAINTNARFLARELTALGFRVKRQSSCDDCENAIRHELDVSLQNAELIVITGGLGPTPDDVTRDSIAKYFRVPLVFSQKQFDRIKVLYSKFGRRVPALVKCEAMFPQNAKPLINDYGIAMGFAIPLGQKLIITLPGVPREMEKMFSSVVLQLLRKHFLFLKAIPAMRVNLTGISEPAVMKALGKDFFDDPFDFGIYPYPGEVSICIQARSRPVIDRLRRKIAGRLSDFIYGWDETSLSEVVGRLLMRRNKTLAIAESCTGGLMAAEITNAPGASRYFKGAVTAYDNAIKKSLVGVDSDLIERKGAVSKEVAVALASGVRKVMRTSFGVGITGIAGPAGGSKAKPVGTVFVAIASAKGTLVWRDHFVGDRQQVRIRTVKKTLERIWRAVKCTTR
jgi:nicotinamide-nucleotide amidase